MGRLLSCFCVHHGQDTNNLFAERARRGPRSTMVQLKMLRVKPSPLPPLLLHSLCRRPPTERLRRHSKGNDGAGRIQSRATRADQRRRPGRSARVDTPERRRGIVRRARTRRRARRVELEIVHARPRRAGQVGAGAGGMSRVRDRGRERAALRVVPRRQDGGDEARPQGRARARLDQARHRPVPREGSGRLPQGCIEERSRSPSSLQGRGRDPGPPG
mmetsp:Transcript_21336/g.48115  ORF Transcript_21336/g.48115 Transcript_21336/m.48115 type:complete len:217 (+) Transcript_21336:53-703(+)